MLYPLSYGRLRCRGILSSPPRSGGQFGAGDRGLTLLLAVP